MRRDDTERLKRLVLDTLPSLNSRRAYDRALTAFFAWYRAEPRAGFTRALVQEYRAALESSRLAPSSINVALSALRKLAAEAGLAGLLDDRQAAAIGAVKSMRQAGARTGNWLTREQARQLLAAPGDNTPAGLRDRALLALLLGCGLRRAELAALTVSSLEERDGRCVIADLVGKGRRLRTVPVPGWVKSVVDAWTSAAGITAGPLFRSSRGAGISPLRETPLTEKMVWYIVRKYARRIGIERLAPHDLRRTCARLCRSSGGELEQIQLLLGHASIQTTERYLGTRQNLREAVNDRLGLEP